MTCLETGCGHARCSSRVRSLSSSLEDVLSRELDLTRLHEKVCVLAKLRAVTVDEGRDGAWSCCKRASGCIQRAEPDVVQHVEDLDRYLELLLFEGSEGLGETVIHGKIAVGTEGIALSRVPRIGKAVVGW